MLMRTSAEEESCVPATGKDASAFKLLQSARLLFTICRSPDGCILGWLQPSLGKAGISCQTAARSPSPPLPCFKYISKGDTLPRNNRTKRSPMRPKSKNRREWHVNQVLSKGYLAMTHRFRETREADAEIDTFRRIDHTVALLDTEGASRKATEQAKSNTSAQLSVISKRSVGRPCGIPRCCRGFAQLGWGVVTNSCPQRTLVSVISSRVGRRGHKKRWPP